MKVDQHYVDPRLVALYDRDNPRGADTEFYVRLATRLGAHRILDLGCGTGLMTRELAIAGRQVVGVDPAPMMLAHARRQAGADEVQWVEGDSSALGEPEADLAIMTGNVAQVFLNDAQWDATLGHLHAAIRGGGTLAFESRNPDNRAWEGWHRKATYERVDSLHGPMECWLDVVSVGYGRVHFMGHNVFTTTGEDVVVESELRFRSQAELTDSLLKAGFTIEHVYGDWNCGPVTQASRAMIFVANRS
ncbi:MAG: class I SAM-dependent methyltransferase [Trueperaceae bacterium]